MYENHRGQRKVIEKCYIMFLGIKLRLHDQACSRILVSIRTHARSMCMNGLSMRSHGEPKNMFITIFRHPWIKTAPIHVSTYPKA